MLLDLLEHVKAKDSHTTKVTVIFSREPNLYRTSRAARKIGGLEPIGPGPEATPSHCCPALGSSAHPAGQPGRPPVPGARKGRSPNRSRMPWLADVPESSSSQEADEPAEGFDGRQGVE